MRRWIDKVLFCLAVLTFPVIAPAAEMAADKGVRLAREADARFSGFGDSVAAMHMILRNARGDEAVRALRIKTLEVDGEGDRSLVIFDQPRDIAGTALLSHSRGVEPDDQWLYLPELKRVKRISGANRSGPFMGSEFAFEDLTAPEVAKYDHLWLRDAPCGPFTCHVIERRPRYTGSGYSRQEVWLDSAELRPMRVDFFDRRGDHIKTLTYGDYRLYEGRFWRAHDLFMENLRTGKSTRLVVSQFAFRTGLSEADFSRASLKRVR
ncbi:MAG: outer membrane lipoprotein-sorting protein [Alphaproteobacteria bacterium]|nr:MAG: outer membrane lipoprotein-sorting protein [Alphaproteobacteria bacterium]